MKKNDNKPTDTNFSRIVKGFLFMFMTKESMTWAMADTEITENTFTFELVTEFFHGFVVIKDSPHPSKFQLAYVDMNTVRNDDVEKTSIIMHRNALVVEGCEMTEYLGYINKPHPAPQSNLIPREA